MTRRSPALLQRALLRPLTAALLLAALASQQAHAGLFDDDEARRQISDLTSKTNERLDTASKGQLELANQIQSLREENARLRGQVETLVYELESAKKRQQDFYVDLDERLRKMEIKPAAAPQSAPAEETTAPAKPAADPAAESRDYEAALNLFKAGKLKEAAAGFEAFGKAHPESSLTPNAHYWLGNAQYALRDCRKAIDTHRGVFTKWPEHAKAPDAMLNVATCQQELGDLKNAQTTLQAVVIKYPDAPAAATARQRLKKK